MDNWTNFKPRGTVGELAVAKDLILRGYAVFTELGDNSRVDLIALVENNPVKIQVKTCTGDNDIASFDVVKKTFGYKYKYSVDDVDLFALYILSTDQILYVSSKEALQQKSMISFKMGSPGRINQFKQRFVKDYLDFHKALSFEGVVVDSSE